MLKSDKSPFCPICCVFSLWSTNIQVNLLLWIFQDCSFNKSPQTFTLSCVSIYSRYGIPFQVCDLNADSLFHWWRWGWAGLEFRCQVGCHKESLLHSLVSLGESVWLFHKSHSNIFFKITNILSWLNKCCVPLLLSDMLSARIKKMHFVIHMSPIVYLRLPLQCTFILNYKALSGVCTKCKASLFFEIFGEIPDCVYSHWVRTDIYL